MNRAVARLGLRAEWSPHPFFFPSFSQGAFVFGFVSFFPVLGNMLNKLHRVHGRQLTIVLTRYGVVHWKLAEHLRLRAYAR